LYLNSLEGLAFLDFSQAPWQSITYWHESLMKNTLLFTRNNTVHFATSSGTIKTKLSLLSHRAIPSRMSRPSLRLTVLFSVRVFPEMLWSYARVKGQSQASAHHWFPAYTH